MSFSINNLELTFENHFKWGYGGDFHIWRQDLDEDWVVQYGMRTFSECLDWKTECLNAAKKIHSRAHGQTIWLCLSGGIDSEVMVRSFHEAEVPFEIATLRFKDELNSHDIYWAQKLADELNLKLHAIDLDIIRFFEDGRALDMALATQSINAEMLGTMHLMDQLDGFPVLGSGECLLAREEVTGYVPGFSPYTQNIPWDLWEKESVSAWYKYFILRNRQGAPGFFQYTPELISSFMKDELVQALIQNQIVGKLTSESSKAKIYNRYWRLEGRKKFNGYEELQNYIQDLFGILGNLQPGVGQIYKTRVSQWHK